MRVFFDPSALAKRYVDEAGTAEVLEWCDRADELALAVTAVPELISAFCRLQRERRITAAQYRRLVKRRGDKKAIVAVAHSILVIAYHLLRDGQPYRELGGDFFDRLQADRLTRYHTKRLTALGYTVTLTKAAA